MTRAGSSVILPVIEFVFDCIGEVFDLMSDSRLTSALSFNFLYAILFIWVCWQLVNMFIIRPTNSGDLIDESVKAGVTLRSRHLRAKASAQEKASRDAERRRTKTYTRNYYKRDKKTDEGNTTTYEG